MTAEGLSDSLSYSLSDQGQRTVKISSELGSGGETAQGWSSVLWEAGSSLTWGRGKAS